MKEMQETWVRNLGQDDLLEEEMSTHSSILAWRMPWTEEPASYGGWCPRSLNSRSTVYIGFCTFCSFRHPLGVLESIPHGLGETTMLQRNLKSWAQTQSDSEAGCSPHCEECWEKFCLSPSAKTVSLPVLQWSL